MKKLLATILVFITLLGVFAKPAKAADNFWYIQDFGPWYTKTFNTDNPQEIFGERYTAAQVQWVFYSIPAHLLTSFTFGRPEPWICVFSADMSECVVGTIEVLKEVITRVYNFFSFPIRLVTDAGGQTHFSYVREGEKLSLYSFFYNNPQSGIGYTLRKASDFHLVPEAKAQGFGYNFGGNAVQKLWKASRDITYSLLVFVIIIISFMIMFRMKISPQAVITAQSALPKLVIGVILITFSYAIAGFMIDLMYVVIGIIAIAIKQSGLTYFESSIDLFKVLTSDANVFVLSWHYVLMFLLGTITTILSSGLLGGLILIVLFCVVLVVTIFNSFKVLWLMIKTYASIILSIVVAPFQILLGIVSPSGGGIGPWMKSFAGNLAVYPVVGVLFFIAFFFIVQATMIGTSNGGVVGGLNDLNNFLGAAAPFQINTGVLSTTTSWDPPLTWGTNSGRFLWMLASFAVFMMIPKTAEIIKGFITGKEYAYGTAIGEAFGTAKTVGAMPVQYMGSMTASEYKIAEQTPGALQANRGLRQAQAGFDVLRRIGFMK